MKLIRFRKKLKNSTKIQAILCLNSSPLIHSKNSWFFFEYCEKQWISISIISLSKLYYFFIPISKFKWNTICAKTDVIFQSNIFLKKLCQQRIERHVCQILFWKKGSFSNPLLLLVHSSKFQGVLHKNFKLKILFYFYRSENPKLIFYFPPHPPILMSLKIKNGKSNFEYSYKDFSGNFLENTKSEFGRSEWNTLKTFCRWCIVQMLKYDITELSTSINFFNSLVAAAYIAAKNAKIVQKTNFPDKTWY